MTRAELVSLIYANYDAFHKIWQANLEEKGFGLMVFVPEGYESAHSREELTWQYWRREQLESQFLKKSALTQMHLKRILAEQDKSNEGMLVVIVANSQSRAEIHLQYVTKLYLN